MIEELRIGEKGINNQNLEMTIINYRNNADIDVQFSDGSITENVKYYNFKRGAVKNHNIPTYLDKGYRGYGKYKTRVNNVKTEEYVKWGAMLTRCYSEKLKQRENYIGCYVCDEWLNFQNFAEWYNNNTYYLPSNETLELDKDIKVKENKVYSPDTCILIPKRLNSIILNRHNDRGKECIGVYFNRKLNKYQAKCNRENNMTYIGLFNTEHEAFIAYKEEKENEIRRVLDLYKDYIPTDVYNAVLSYRIEMND